MECLLRFVLATSLVIAVEESPSYVVSMKAKNAQLVGHRTVTMRSNSKNFKCVLPDTSVKEDKLLTQLHTSTAVRSHLTSGCFSKTVDYWTYEVCPFGTVKQYHKEGNSITTSIHLGEHDVSKDVESEEEQPSYKQEYTNGQDGRQAVVLYYCPNAQEARLENPSFIREIKEPMPLHYEVVVVTPHACTKHLETALSLTRPLENTCSYLNTGWWTYRFCHLRSLTQLHQEKDSVLAEFDLGTFPSDVDMETYTEVIPNTDPKHAYLTYWLEDGSECDVTKRKRRTEVRMYCDPVESLLVKSVEETQSCVYQVKVSTRLLCPNAVFERPVPRVFEIGCQLLEDR